MFDPSEYGQEDLDRALSNHVHVHSTYNGVLVDKDLNVILQDLILHSIEIINIVQELEQTDTNILCKDKDGFKFHEDAKSWFSHILDHNYEDSDEECANPESRFGQEIFNF